MLTMEVEITDRFAKSLLKQVFRLHQAIAANDIRTVRQVKQLARKRREYHGRGLGWLYLVLNLYADKALEAMAAGRAFDLNLYFDHLENEYPMIVIHTWLVPGVNREQAEMMMFLNSGKGNWPTNKETLR